VSAAVLAIGLGYVALLWAFGPLPPLSFPRQLLQFWVGDVIGIFVMTPALLVHRGGLRLYPRSEREWIAQACAIAGTLWLLWGVEADLAPRLFYLLFLPLVWIGVRNSIEGTTLALIGIQFGLIAGVELSGRSSEMILELQLLMLTLVFTGLFLGASVSEWRLTEAALRERQAELDETLKLAAATETASALAHELNQPLTAIASYVGASQLMLDRPLENRERLASALGAAGREASRAGDVIRRLRDFFRSGAKALERVPVRALVIDSVDAMRPSLEHHRIAIQVDCGPALGDVVVDRLQLESVLHQLLQNAIEAIADGASHAREVVIRARRSLDTVTLAVRDTGPGIDPELGDAIFSPFKTTKALGTGLGLAIGRTIVENHGGKLEYETSPQGATFVVTLPSAAAEGAP
jgi:signal transduction histidine kinase